MLDRRRRTEPRASTSSRPARVAGAVRDRLSPDNWRVLEPARRDARAPAARPPALAEALELIDRAIVSLVAVGGLEMAHMTRDDGWRFLSLGRHLERLLFVATTVGEVGRRRATRRSGRCSSGCSSCPTAPSPIARRYMRHPEWLAGGRPAAVRPAQPALGGFQLAKLAKHVRLLAERRPRGADRRDRRARRRCAASPSRATGEPSCSARARSRTSSRRCERLALAPVGRAHAALLQPRLRDRRRPRRRSERTTR